MSKEEKDPFWQSSGEIGYGKPPVHRRFVKGQSGNPRGRPKTSSKKPSMITDTSGRDRFLAGADKKITIREGDALKEITVVEAAERALSLAALKGNAHAAKIFLERETLLRKELIAEVRTDNDFWREYAQKIRDRIDTGWVLPVDCVHPDDLVFDYMEHVKIRGGDPTIANQNRTFMVDLRDLLILQAAKDIRDFHSRFGRAKQAPLLVSELFVIHINSCLPQRLQLDDLQIIVRTTNASKLRKRRLQQKITESWKTLGMPEMREFARMPLLPLLAKLGI